MFTPSAATFQALSHAHVAVLLPEMTLPAYVHSLVENMLLDFLESRASPRSH
jgi:hypothetical protein